jgi:hypothetical protein
MFWMGAVAGGLTLAAWLLRETVLSRALAGLVSAAAGYLAGIAMAHRFLHGEPFSIPWMIGVVGVGPLGALLALALAIKLTEKTDGSRAMVTAGAAASMLLLFR